MGLCDMVMMSKACEWVTFILLCVTWKGLMTLNKKYKPLCNVCGVSFLLTFAAGMQQFASRNCFQFVRLRQVQQNQVHIFNSSVVSIV